MTDSAMEELSNQHINISQYVDMANYALLAEFLDENPDWLTLTKSEQKKRISQYVEPKVKVTPLMEIRYQCAKGHPPKDGNPKETWCGLNQFLDHNTTCRNQEVKVGETRICEICDPEHHTSRDLHRMRA